MGFHAALESKTMTLELCWLSSKHACPNTPEKKSRASAACSWNLSPGKREGGDTEQDLGQCSVDRKQAGLWMGMKAAVRPTVFPVCSPIHDVRWDQGNQQPAPSHTDASFSCFLFCFLPEVISGLLRSNGRFDANTEQCSSPGIFQTEWFETNLTPP